MPRKQTYLTEVVADENEEPPEEFEDAQEQLDDDPADGGEELADPADEDDGQEAYDDDVTQDLASLAQVLTVTARKLSGVTLGRKFSTGKKSKKRSPPQSEYAFLNEEHFRPHREKLELAAGCKRHERLVELGVLREEDDEIMGPRRPDCEERRAYGAPAGPAGARSMNLKNGHAKRTRLELEYKALRATAQV
eukprot:g1145.t1